MTDAPCIEADFSGRHSQSSSPQIIQHPRATGIMCQNCPTRLLALHSSHLPGATSTSKHLKKADPLQTSYGTIHPQLFIFGP